MARQLVFTSAQQGLTQGRTGFCTVARHRDLRERLVPMLEGLSVYPHGTQPAPVICAFRLVDVAGTRFPVLSRLVDAGTDYTQRTNFLAHHLILEPMEVAGLPSPAEIFLRWPGWLNRWVGAPRWLEAADLVDLRALPPALTPALPAQNWLQLTGHAGRAALLLEDNAAAEAVLLCKPEQEASLLGLLRESAALLGPSAAWRTTFTTWRQDTDQAGDFLWAVQRVGMKAPAPSWGDERILDLTKPNTLAPAPSNALAQRARDGGPVPVTAARPPNSTATAAATLSSEVAKTAASAPAKTGATSASAGQNTPQPAAKKPSWLVGAGAFGVLAAMVIGLAGTMFFIWSKLAESPANAPATPPATAVKIAAEPIPAMPSPSPATEPLAPSSAIFPPSPPPAPAAPMVAEAQPPNSDKQESAFSNLGVVEVSLQIAQAALDKANAGGQVARRAKIIAEVNNAAANTDAAIAFIKAHPEADALPTGPGPEDGFTNVPSEMPAGHQPGKAPQWERAFAALYTAYHELTNNPDPDFRGPIWSDLGGYRDKIRQDVGTALIDIYAHLELTSPGSGGEPAPISALTPLNPINPGLSASAPKVVASLPTDVRALTLLHLQNAQADLQSGLGDLISAAPGNKTTMAKAIASMNTALTDTAAALAFVNSHSDSVLLSSRPAQSKAVNVYILHVETGSPALTKVPQKLAAYLALREAQNELVVSNDPKNKEPKLGDISGYRLRILRDLNQASVDLLANVGIGGGIVMENADGVPNGFRYPRMGQTP